MTTNEKKWLVVIFVHEISIFRKIIQDRINEVEKNGCGEGTVVYLMRDSVTIAGNMPNFTLTISRLRQETPGQFHFEEVKDIVFENSDRHCWEKGLYQIFEREKAGRNMIITLSHGAAFGFNREFSTINRPEIWNEQTGQYEYLGPDNFMHAYSNAHYYFDEKEIENIQTFAKAFNKFDFTELRKGRLPKGNDKPVCRNLEILWTSDFARALKKLPGDPVIDVMLMVNCYMQSFDTGYILRKRVKYLVAAETGIPANGFNFSNIIKQLDHDNLETKVLLQLIIDEYKTTNPPGTPNSIHTAFSANGLTEYRKALKLFMHVIKILEENMPEIGSKLVEIRNNIRYVSIAEGVYNSNELMMIDAGLWLSLIFDHLPWLFRDTFLPIQFKLLLNDIVVSQHVGEDFSGDIDTFGMNGISLFYPTTEDFRNLKPLPWCAYFDDKVPSPFRKDSRWNKFLKAYYDLKLPQ